MADQPLPPPATLAAIRWREAFPFTNLFRAFRVAIQPSKIFLGLVALLLLYVGGSLLDQCCRVQYRAVPEEALAYEAFVQHARSGDRFSDVRDDIRRAVESTYADRLLQYHVVASRDDAIAAAQRGDDLPQLKRAIEQKRDAELQVAQRSRDNLLSAARQKSEEARRSDEAAARDEYNRAVRAVYDDAAAQYDDAKTILGQGLFVHFFSYELNQISNVVAGVAEGNFFGKSAPADLSLSMAIERAAPDPAADGFAVGAGGPFPLVPPAAAAARPGVVPSLIRFFTVGPVWLLTQHPLYFVLLAIYFLSLWAVFGGAISRIAAVHIARDEKLSIRSAMQFSVGKFLSFLLAPIIPLLIVIVVGLMVTVGSLALGNIPVIGPILVGIFFIVALVAGFAMAVVLLLVGGFNLMYPTIAVEGSDSFDAISRSFSYLYARPWRLGFYTAVAIIYGALTYQFVRLFLFLMLLLTHKFVGMGMYVHAENGAPVWTTMWPNPGTAARLTYHVDYMALTFPQAVGAAIVSGWVHLAIAMLGAFAISFYFTSNTIIYYLMRREVDATEMDDVYLEQVEDEFADAMPDELPAPASTSPAASTPEVETGGADSPANVQAPPESTPPPTQENPVP
jgi:hypothetical protein